MPEIKHTFQGGKMNKDLDERLVQNGEYRDAENIQVRTSGGNAIGTIQNIKGTAEVGTCYYEDWMDDTPPVVVASVVDEKSDKAYFFFASSPVEDFVSTYGGIVVQNVDSERIFVDSIIEQDVNGDTHPVVIDRHTIINTLEEVLGSFIPMNQYTSPYTILQVEDASKYRIGMTVKALAPDLNNPDQYVDLFTEYQQESGGEIITTNGNGAIIKAIDVDNNIITFYEEQVANIAVNQPVYFIFEAEPVLNFQGNQITGINVIDNLLFWTDNLTEPKKINIDRCKAGSRQAVNMVLASDYHKHTRLFSKHQILSTSSSDETLVSIDEVNPGLESHPINIDLKEEHLTVLRRAPRVAPTLEMKNTKRAGNVDTTILWTAIDTDSPDLDVGEIIVIEDPSFEQTSFQSGDVINITPMINEVNAGIVKVTFLNYVEPQDDIYVPSGGGQPTDWIQVEVVNVGDGIPAGEQEWTVILLQQKPLFELKMCRFGYRYKYEDGEYSSFSPWSELAFLPGTFDLVVKKAYNLGMVNTLRSLIIKDFIPYKRPLDVISVDILFKTANEPNVYIVKTIKRTKDDEWELFTPSTINPDIIKTGRLSITSEMIHKVLPSDQLLRSWDNVPRYALAQEITANRLIYGNYTQGYPFIYPVGLTQRVNSTNDATLTNPAKSIKSIRNYKWGMVFGDKYGRETPVIESGIINYDNDDFESATGDIIVNKDIAWKANSFILKQSWDSIAAPNGEPPDWADYVKYYVKETSNEYYNMVMDRWYWADEENFNVWLSFNSADRNKVDEETYLLLKNQHGNHTPVEDEARFKIIAIEPDAPDFVKTVNRILGIVEIDPFMTRSWTNYGGAYPVAQQTIWESWTYDASDVSNMTFTGSLSTDNVGQPTGLMNNTSLQIHLQSWTIGSWDLTSGGANQWNYYNVEDFTTQMFGRRIEGDMTFRVKGTNSNYTLYTEWRTIHHYRYVDAPVQSTSPQAIEINWAEAFGDSADMATRFENAGYGEVTKMELEFSEAKVMQRPQFDGKFFVKIEKNAELEINVLYSDGSGAQYVDGINSMHLRNVNEDFAQIAAGFAQCDSNLLTKNFWDSLLYLAGAFPYAGGPMETADLGSRMFFDDATPFFGIYELQNEDGTTQTVELGNNGIEIEDIGGSISRGTLPVGSDYEGRMILSRLDTSWLGSNWADYDGDGQADPGIDNVNNWPYQMAVQPADALYANAADAIMTALLNEGQKFKFSNDPNQRIYETIWGSQATGVGGNPRVSNYGGVIDNNENTSAITAGNVDYVTDDITNCTPCGSASPLTNVGNGACYRKSVVIDFRLLDETINAPINDVGLNLDDWDPRSAMGGGGAGPAGSIVLVGDLNDQGSAAVRKDLGACWETEPKDDIDLDIYYEASNAIPIKLTEYNSFDFAPINSTMSLKRWVNDELVNVTLTNTNQKVANIEFTNDTSLIYITSEDGLGQTVPHVYDVALNDVMFFTHSDGTQTQSEVIGIYAPEETPITNSTTFIPATQMYPVLTFNPTTEVFTLSDIENVDVGMYIFSIGDYSNVIPNGTTIATVDSTTSQITLNTPSLQAVDFIDANADGVDDYEFSVLVTNQSGHYEVDDNIWKYEVKLGWFNCYSFGNGVESDRVRDDYNAARMGLGVRASTTFSGYGEEKKSSGMIYSGLYNSTSEVNDLNEFNMGEKIQKDLNPAYGSIQAFKTRDKNVVVLTEDRVLQVLAAKDALFNADGNPQLTATNRVLGTAIPYAGDFGISQNPESLAWDQYRIYFTDKQRGAVLRLSMDGLTPISNVGMKEYFRDNLKKCGGLLGTFDAVNGEYNLTLNYKFDEFDPVTKAVYPDTTLSFNEGSKGWVSFKSFIPQAGCSVSGKYITARDQKIWDHYRTTDQTGTAINYNNFYGTQYESSFTVLFNDMPSVVKGFNSINYEGTQSKVNLMQHDDEYFNLNGQRGWYVESFETDLNSGFVPEFRDKENKWFNRIHGSETTLTNLNTNEFTVQGIGVPTVLGQELTSVTLRVQNNELTQADSSPFAEFEGASESSTQG